jgi:putative Mg2+ transporter-C (MgtC) family protein
VSNWRPIDYRRQRFTTPAGHDNKPLQNTEIETNYTCSIVCHCEDEAHVRALLLYAVNNASMTLRCLDSADLDNTHKVQAKLMSLDRNDALLEHVVSRLSLEPGVSAVGRQVVITGVA